MTSSHGYGLRTRAIKWKPLVCSIIILLLFCLGSARAEIIAPPADKTPLQTMPAIDVPVVPAVPPSAAEETLVLQLTINGEEMTEFIEGLKVNNKTYLPLHQLSSFLDLPITIDAAKKTADGWFINEDNKIKIDEKTAVVKGNSYDVTPDVLMVRDGDMFIETEILQKWLPLTFVIDQQNLVLHITTREKLPFEEARNRKKTQKSFEQNKREEKEEDYKTIRQEYDAIQWPSVDITYSPSYQSTTDKISQTYTVLAAGDFGFLTTKLYAGGDLSDEALSDLRLTLGRDDYEHKLLGPLRASSFSFGDITSVSLDQATSSGTGRGVTVTNRDLDRPDQFDVTSFIGDSKPGWDVELYRNDALVGFQTVGTNGRYEFLNVPIFFGTNVFRLAFYGPQGQRDEIIKTYDADSSLLEKGQFTYNISADQKNQSLFGIGDTATPASTTGNTVDPDVPRMVGEFEYGLTRWLTATAGSAYTTVNNEHRSYVTSGLHASAAGMLLALDHAQDVTHNGFSTQASITTRKFNTDIQIKQRIADNFISEADNTGVTSQTDIGLNRDLSLPFFGTFGNNLLLTRKHYDTGRKEDLVTHTLTKQLPFLGMSLSNALTLNSDNNGLDTKQGVLTLHGSYKRLQLEVQAEYDIDPENKLRKTKLTALYPITDRILNNTILSNTRTDTTLTELENTVTIDMEKYKLSLTGRVDNKHTIFVGASVNTSLGKVPGTSQIVMSSQSMAATGTVAVRPFIDSNYNQTYDKGEEITAGGGIRIGGQGLKLNDKGYVVATQLPTNLPVTIKVDPLLDPFALNQQSNPNLIGANYRVVPRPGKVTVVDFPMFETSQIDGVVKVPEGFDAGSLLVEAQTTEGQVVGSTYTSFDGYFLLEGLMPGTYKLRISGPKLDAAGIVRADDRALTIDKSDLYTQDVTMAEASLEWMLDHDPRFPPLTWPPSSN